MAGKTISNIPALASVLTADDVYNETRNPNGSLVGRDSLAGLTDYISLDSTVRSESISQGVVRVTADFDKSLKPPVIVKITDAVNGGENEITSRGPVIMEGDNLVWDDSQPDEGFFLNLLGIETKMVVKTPDPAGKRLVLQAERQAMTPGDKPTIWFYFRRSFPSNVGEPIVLLASTKIGQLTAVEGGDPDWGQFG